MTGNRRSTVRQGVFSSLRRTLPLIVALAIVASLGRILVPIVVQLALDHSLIANDDRADGTRRLVSTVAIGVLGIAAAWTASWTLNRRLVAIVEDALVELRVSVVSRVLRLPARTLEQQDRGVLVSRVTSDVDTVTQYVSSGGITLVLNLVQMLMAAGVMFFYSWWLALLVLIVTTPFIIAMTRVRAVVRARFTAVRTAVGQVHRTVSELVRGLEVVRAFGLSPSFEQRSHRIVREAESALRRTQWPLHFGTSLGEAAGNIVTVAVLLVGVAAGTSGLPAFEGLTAGRLIAFLFLITYFVRPLQFTVTSIGEAQSAVAGIRRTQEILDLPPEYEDFHHGRELPDDLLDVEFSDVEFAYGTDHPALSDVELRIPAGQFVAVVGHTGSGKSTLGKLVTRQLRAAPGAVAIAGIPVEELSAAALVKRVAVVPQDSFLFDTTVRDNLLVADPSLQEDELLRTLERLGLGDWIASLPRGLDTPVGQSGTALSAGERQLVALARTALVDPDILVLDEATSNVDPQLESRIQRALRSVAAGRTTIAIAHRLNTAELADRVVVLDRGRVVEDGPPATLYAAGGFFAALSRAWHAHQLDAMTDGRDSRARGTDDPQQNTERER